MNGSHHSLHPEVFQESSLLQQHLFHGNDYLVSPFQHAILLRRVGSALMVLDALLDAVRCELGDSELKPIVCAQRL
jgi:hypothetical protein